MRCGATWTNKQGLQELEQFIKGDCVFEIVDKGRGAKVLHESRRKSLHVLLALWTHIRALILLFYWHPRGGGDVAVSVSHHPPTSPPLPVDLFHVHLLSI